jgi:hypothetical protein
MVDARSEFPHSLLFALRRLYKVSEVRGMGTFSFIGSRARTDPRQHLHLGGRAMQPGDGRLTLHQFPQEQLYLLSRAGLSGWAVRGGRH